MPRLLPLRDPVTMELDGEPVPAERGEPAVAALVAAGQLAIARSPKFHRPRGPACLRAACDGCLARVDGVPNVMTCRVPAADGMRIEAQNVVGSKDTDLLRVADWFFPEGMNHHELLAGVPGIQRVMQGFARRVAGLGTLPDQGRAPRAARRREVDVLVVGAGPAGMAAATELAGRGRDVLVVDDDLSWGGSARVLEATHRLGPSRGAAGVWGPLVSAFQRSLHAPGVRIALRTTAAGVYGDDVLLSADAPPRGGSADPEAAEVPIEVVRAKTLVLAPGAHDGALAFEGNDVPGVMSARAACRLLSHGVTPGKRVAVVLVGGGTAFGHAYAAADPGATVIEGVPRRVSGSARVRGVALETGAGTVACDALLVDAPLAPAYELCAQAGATLDHEARGFVVRAPGGRIRDGVFAIGEVRGTPLEPGALMAEASRL